MVAGEFNHVNLKTVPPGFTDTDKDTLPLLHDACMWQCIQDITRFRSCKHALITNSGSLAEELNHFFTRSVRGQENAASLQVDSADIILTLQTHDVK